MEMVTISKYYKNPKIYHSVVNADLELRISLEDFMAGIIEELGSPTFILTAKQFEDRLKEAMNTVLERVKEESAKTIKSAKE